VSTLRKAVEDYIQMRRNLGFKLHEANRALLRFVSFLEKRGASHITIPLAMQWAHQNPAARPREWARRLSYIRGFARYQSATDPQTEVPPVGLAPYGSDRARPYLYSDDEIQRLLEAALKLSPTHGLRDQTYYTLFGLLSVTGLRISEALNLRSEDVDLAERLLTIRDSKFGKSRLVPIHVSTEKALSDYASRRDIFLAGRPAARFFVSKYGAKLDGGDVRNTFYDLSRQIGLRAPSDSRGPRIHDFRHRFAMQTLLQWYQSNQDVERRLPILSTYLGHVNPANTYWYLTACSQLMGLAAKRFDKRWEGQS